MKANYSTRRARQNKGKVTATKSAHQRLSGLLFSTMSLNTPPDLQYYGFPEHLTLERAIQRGARFGFRVQHANSGTTYVPNRGFFASGKAVHILPSTKPGDSIASIPDSALRGATLHMSNVEEHSSSFISLSLCPFWPIWWICHRLLLDHQFSHLTFHIIEIALIRHQAALGVEFVEEASKRKWRFMPNPLGKAAQEKRKASTNSAQECLVWNNIPGEAVIASLPLEVVLRYFPSSVFFEKGSDLSAFIGVIPLIHWPWNDYMRTPGFSQFRGFLRHCHSNIDDAGLASTELASLLLRSKVVCFHEAIIEPSIRYLALLVVHRARQSSLIDEAVRTQLLIETVIRQLAQVSKEQWHNAILNACIVLSVRLSTFILGHKGECYTDPGSDSARVFKDVVKAVRAELDQILSPNRLDLVAPAQWSKLADEFSILLDLLLNDARSEYTERSQFHYAGGQWTQPCIACPQLSPLLG